MSNLEGVSKALKEWASQAEPGAICLLQLDAQEIGLLHYCLEVIQDMLQRSRQQVEGMEVLGSLRKKVEDVLILGGYGGKGRP